MAQRTQMYYAYLRFYIDESKIEAGLNEYCTGWEHMFEVGYNYKEYKCFVDNLGGFEHFIGDMRGYIRQERETGFIDGSPSDSMYDSSLLMGAQKITDDDFLTLNAVVRGKTIYFRKISAQDAGIAHKVKVVSGDAVLTHPVMYTLDTNQIETLKPEDDIVDSSDVDSYEYTADTPVAWLTGGIQDSLTCGTVTNFANAVDRDKTTYARFQTGNNALCDLIIDMGESFTAIAIYYHNHYDPHPKRGLTVISTSPDKITWTVIGNKGFTDFYGTASNNNISARYIKFHLDSAAPDTYCICDIYRILCS